MIRSLIAASLALSTAVAPATAATTFTENDLLNYFKEVGGRVYIDSDLCEESGAFGIQYGTAIHLCTEPHQGNTAEWRDTIRHELWHVVQMCNKGPISGDPIEAIVHANAKGWTGKGYKPEHWHHEAEAYFAAAEFSAEQIKDSIKAYCL